MGGIGIIIDLIIIFFFLIMLVYYVKERLGQNAEPRIANDYVSVNNEEGRNWVSAKVSGRI